MKHLGNIAMLFFYVAMICIIIFLGITIYNDTGKFELEKEEITLSSEGTYRIGIDALKRKDRENSKYKYKSADTNIAEVSDDGLITPKGNGTTEITVTRGRHSEKIKVTVTDIPMDSIILSDDSIVIKVGEIYDLKKIMNSSDVVYNYKYASRNSNIASVSSKGIITGKNPGTTEIVIATNNNVMAGVTITVVEDKVDVTSVVVNKESLTLKVGNTYSLSAKVYPENATNKNVTWISSNSDIVSVSSNGKIKAKRTGSATITAKTSNGVSDSTIVTVKANSVKPKKPTEPVNPYEVTDISLNRETATISVGGKVKVNYTISPATATNKNVTWSISDKSVISVSRDGIITGLKVGTSKATVKTYNNKTATITVTVTSSKVYPTNIKLNAYSKAIYVGDIFDLVATLEPNNTTENSVTWTSSNPKVATVVNGRVKGISAGTAVITAKTVNGKTAQSKITVSVKTVNPTGIKLNTNSLKIGKGKSARLVATIEPSNATNKTIRWSSSNTSVAKVVNGTVTGVNTGTATITAETVNGIKASATVKVVSTSIDPTSITVKPTVGTIYIGRTTTLTATVLPTNTTDKTVTWISSNTKIATVNNKGVVTGVGAGKVVITARTNNGKTATSTITVVKQTINPTGIKVSPTSNSINIGDIYYVAATVLPSNATNKTVTWTSSNAKVATVDKQGLVTGIGVGTANITAKTSNGKTATSTVTVVKKTINPTGISLNITNKSIYKGSSFVLTTTIKPSNATNKSVTWSSSNEKVAVVKNGTVTGKGNGTATITAKTSNGKTATCKVTVTTKVVNPTGISLNATTVKLGVDKSATLVATITPSNATDKTIKWSSSNSKVVKVSNGKITGLKAGTAVITAATSNNLTATATVTVVAKSVEPTGIKLNATSKTINKGVNTTLVATVEPANATDKTVIWSSSNTAIATVSNGKVTGIKAGTATITAKTSNGKTATAKIKVVVNPTGISINKTSATIYKGHSVTLTATVLPSDATNKNVTWTSSNTSIATVANGKVSGLKAGKVTITAKTSNGKTATATITVSANNPSLVDTYFLNTQKGTYLDDNNKKKNYNSNAAIIIKTADNKCVLLDTANSINAKGDTGHHLTLIKNGMEKANCKKSGKYHLDYLIISHLDPDHYGNAIHISTDKNIVVDNLIIKYESLKTSTFNKIVSKFKNNSETNNGKNTKVNVIGKSIAGTTQVFKGEGSKLAVGQYLNLYFYNVSDVYVGKTCYTGDHIEFYNNKASKFKVGSKQLYVYFEGSEYVSTNQKPTLKTTTTAPKASSGINQKFYAIKGAQRSTCRSNVNALGLLAEVNNIGTNKYMYFANDIENGGVDIFDTNDGNGTTVVYENINAVKFDATNKKFTGGSAKTTKILSETKVAQNIKKKLNGKKIVIYQISHHGYNNSRTALNALGVNNAQTKTIITNRISPASASRFIYVRSYYYALKNSKKYLSGNQNYNGVKCYIKNNGDYDCAYYK